MSLDLLINQLVSAIQNELNQVSPPSIAHQVHFADIPPRFPSQESLASKIDHTLLKGDATRREIEELCSEARENQLGSVCVNSSSVELAANLLKGSSSRVVAVVGFPLGASTTATKVFEASEAIRLGAQEIDMVIPLGALKDRDYSQVFYDIHQVVQVSAPHPVKVILETAILNLEQKIIGCALAKAAGAAFVKTSTGFGGGGATVEDVSLMRRIVGPQMGVKASGGIRTFKDAMQMIEAGASRIGASASISIVTQTPTHPHQNGTY